jgi:hypothetical protein
MEPLTSLGQDPTPTMATAILTMALSTTTTPGHTKMGITAHTLAHTTHMLTTTAPIPTLHHLTIAMGITAHTLRHTTHMKTTTTPIPTLHPTLVSITTRTMTITILTLAPPIHWSTSERRWIFPPLQERP